MSSCDSNRNGGEEESEKFSGHGVCTVSGEAIPGFIEGINERSSTEGSHQICHVALDYAYVYVCVSFVLGTASFSQSCRKVGPWPGKFLPQNHFTYLSVIWCKIIK